MKKLLTLTAALMLSSTAFALDKNNTKAEHDYSKTTGNNVVESANKTDRTKDQDKWWRDRDTNNDGRISRQEYVTAETKDGKKTAAEAGAEFDKKDDDKDGYLNASEFKAWFERMGDKVQRGAHKAGDKAHDMKNDVKN